MRRPDHATPLPFEGQDDAPLRRSIELRQRVPDNISVTTVPSSLPHVRSAPTRTVASDTSAVVARFRPRGILVVLAPKPGREQWLLTGCGGSPPRCWSRRSCWSGRSHMQISNSVFLVTGGASGLGAATARLLGSEGAKVVLADVNEAQGKRRGGAGAIGVSDR